ncbi:unnamed protein product [Amoebophrya sp. A120]|nr:unnamed protein product [Amoebophrya sp. A120]|eukprot:GSA120T00024716001.1
MAFYDDYVANPTTDDEVLSFLRLKRDQLRTELSDHESLFAEVAEKHEKTKKNLDKAFDYARMNSYSNFSSAGDGGGGLMGTGAGASRNLNRPASKLRSSGGGSMNALHQIAECDEEEEEEEVQIDREARIPQPNNNQEAPQLPPEKEPRTFRVLMKENKRLLQETLNFLKSIHGVLQQYKQ